MRGQTSRTLMISYWHFCTCSFKDHIKEALETKRVQRCNFSSVYKPAIVSSGWMSSFTEDNVISRNASYQLTSFKMQISHTKNKIIEAKTENLGLKALNRVPCFFSCLFHYLFNPIETILSPESWTTNSCDLPGFFIAAFQRAIAQYGSFVTN